MLLLDIGGGTLEAAFGPDRLPADALSLPLGAGRLTREFLADGDPPPREAVHRMRRHVRKQVRRMAADIAWESARTAAATSATFQQLARLTGAPPSKLGPFVDRQVRRRDLRPWIDRLAGMPARRRAQLPGVSAPRSRQILAGAVVGYELMRALGVGSARLCPWGLREGILLRRLETDQPALGNAAWVCWPRAAEGPPPPRPAHPGRPARPRLAAAGLR
jgi:exopolyphosphatase/guanosine-5'-triphosphate,3'-diphosphate pyrophosphatase